jgi:hypothetical protein
VRQYQLLDITSFLGLIFLKPKIGDVILLIVALPNTG